MPRCVAGDHEAVSSLAQGLRWPGGKPGNPPDRAVPRWGRRGMALIRRRMFVRKLRRRVPLGPFAAGDPRHHRTALFEQCIQGVTDLAQMEWAWRLSVTPCARLGITPTGHLDGLGLVLLAGWCLQAGWRQASPRMHMTFSNVDGNSPCTASRERSGNLSMAHVIHPPVCGIARHGIALLDRGWPA